MASITANHKELTIKRNFLCRLVFGCIFCLLVYDLFSHASLYQLRSPALVFPYVDITYILFNLSGLQTFIGENPVVSFCFTLLLLVLCAAAFAWSSKRLYPILFSIFYFLYFLSYNNYGAHHIHSKIGILFISLPFTFACKDFLFLWQGLRYYTLFIYADAFLWKLFRGTWLFKKEGILMIKGNITSLLFSHPDHQLKSFYEYLFMHPGYADIMFKAGFIIEGVFIVGFFTKKYDPYLVFLSVMLAAGFLFLADAFAFELLILNLTLMYNFRATTYKPVLAST